MHSWTLAKMAARETVLYALRPCRHRTVAAGLASVQYRSMVASASVPARVWRANWKGHMSRSNPKAGRGATLRSAQRVANLCSGPGVIVGAEGGGDRDP